MGIAQCKFGLVMVETPLGDLPIGFSMTVGALLTQSPLVLVVLLVTGVAVSGRLLEHTAQVATLAFDFGMFAEQGKAALIMVKLDRLLPVALVVATGTVLTQGFPVFVILLVTGVALLAELDHKVEFANVATRTLGAAMFAA